MTNKTPVGIVQIVRGEQLFESGVKASLHKLNIDSLMDAYRQGRIDACAEIETEMRLHAEVSVYDWRMRAAEWLLEKAGAQRKTNDECPEHVKCYPSWEQRVWVLNWLAEQLLSAPAQQNALGETP